MYGVNAQIHSVSAMVTKLQKQVIELDKKLQAGGGGAASHLLSSPPSAASVPDGMQERIMHDFQTQLESMKQQLQSQQQAQQQQTQQAQQPQQPQQTRQEVTAAMDALEARVREEIRKERRMLEVALLHKCEQSLARLVQEKCEALERKVVALEASAESASAESASAESASAEAAARRDMEALSLQSQPTTHPDANSLGSNEPAEDIVGDDIRLSQRGSKGKKAPSTASRKKAEKTEKTV